MFRPPKLSQRIQVEKNIYNRLTKNYQKVENANIKFKQMNLRTVLFDM